MFSIQRSQQEKKRQGEVHTDNIQQKSIEQKEERNYTNEQHWQNLFPKKEKLPGETVIKRIQSHMNGRGID